MRSSIYAKVNAIVIRLKREDRTESIPQNLQHGKIVTWDMRKIVRKIKKDFTFSAPQLTCAILEDSGRKVTAETIQNSLKEAGYN